MLTEKTLRKHVAIIHAYSMMSILQRKIVNVLLHNAVKSNTLQSNIKSVAIECTMSLSELRKAIKFNSNNIQYLKETIDGLASLKIEWNLLKDKALTDISFLNLRILHGAPTFYHNHTLNYSFHKVMLDLMQNPSVYGTLDVELQSEFESKYAHALYENSTRFINLQKNKIIPLDTFRKMLGVENNKYCIMRELTRNVLLPSVEEVSDRAHFLVKLQPVTQGRKVLGFEITVKNKKKITYKNDDEKAALNQNAANAIKETFGTMHEVILANILVQYSEAYILDKIFYTKKYAKKTSSGYYPIPYFISALKYDYKLAEEQPSPTHTDSLDTKEIIPTVATEWDSTRILLEADISHWNKWLEYAEQSHNETQIKNINNIILDCQEKIKQHYALKNAQPEVVLL